MAELTRPLDLAGQLQNCAADQAAAIQTFCKYQNRSGPGNSWIDGSNDEQAQKARESAVAVSTQIQALLTTPAELVQRLAREVDTACSPMMEPTTALILCRAKFLLACNGFASFKCSHAFPSMNASPSPTLRFWPVSLKLNCAGLLE